MYSLLSYSFSGEGIVRALSWTLLHSLWQGILLSFVAGAIMLSTKKAKPLLRYNLLSASIILFIVVVVVTFINQSEFSKINTDPNLVHTLPISRVMLSDDLVVNMVQQPVIIQTISFINTNGVWIVLIWLLIVIFKFIRLISGYYYIYKLKHRQISHPAEYWNKRITELCQQLKINKKVALLQSGIVSIPSVIGYLKPVILFPAAMLTALPVNEVEAILIHELGHIRRNDFVMNMLQNIVEMVFFFNPAVNWVSSLIKIERENCCDDIAVTNSNNKKAYINALIKFQDYRLSAPHLATAFSGGKSHLLNRIERIIYNKNKTLNNMEKKFLSISLILVSITVFAFVSKKEQNVSKGKIPILQSVSVSDTEAPYTAANPQDSKKENTSLLRPVSFSPDKTTNVSIVFEKKDTIPVYKSEALQAKAKQAKSNADTAGKDAEQHNPEDKNFNKFANKTGIHFGDDYLTAIYNGKEISKIETNKSKAEIEDWVKKYAPLTGVDLNSLDKSYYIQPAAHTQRTQRTASIQRIQQVVPTPPQTAHIEPINSSEGNTNSGNEDTTHSFTGIYIDENLAIAYIKDKEISRITSKNSKAEMEKWRDDIEKLLNTKFPSIQQNLIDKKKE